MKRDLCRRCDPEALLPDRAELRFGGAVMWFELSQRSSSLIEKLYPVWWEATLR